MAWAAFWDSPMVLVNHVNHANHVNHINQVNHVNHLAVIFIMSNHVNHVNHGSAVSRELFLRTWDFSGRHDVSDIAGFCSFVRGECVGSFCLSFFLFAMQETRTASFPDLFVACLTFHFFFAFQSCSVDGDEELAPKTPSNSWPANQSGFIEGVKWLTSIVLMKYPVG